MVSSSSKAKVRVRLDTTDAKRELKSLAREGEQSTRSLNDRLAAGRGLLGNVAGGFGLGAGVGVGLGVVNRVSGGALGAIQDNLLDGVSARFDRVLGGADARAKQFARQQTLSSFSEAVGRDKSVLPDAVQFFNAVRRQRLPFEQGAIAIREATGTGRADPEGQNVLEKAVDKIATAIADGFQSVIESIGSASSGR